jgi:transcriptional regulator with XRE-family HTH domain
MKFTERFNEALQSCGKTQVQIAHEANVSKQCITDYKSGKSLPSIETLCLFCEALDVSSDYLLELTK